MNTLDEELIKVLNKQVSGCSPYDFFYAFMASHFTDFSKKELKDIIVELYFELYTAQCMEATPSLDTVAKSLEDKWNWI